MSILICHTLCPFVYRLYSPAVPNPATLLHPPDVPNTHHPAANFCLHNQTLQDSKRNQPELMHTRRMSETSGISKANRPKSTIIQRRLAEMTISKRNPELALKISQMRLTIAPIVHVQTGLPGPNFPEMMLNLFLLTEPQLDQLAQYYSQTSPCELTHHYPQTMDWSKPFLCTDAALPADCKLSELERVKVKMRMFARFIGMRGAETPLWEYERQVEIMRNKIVRSIEDEEKSLRKVYLGPGYKS